MNLYTKQSQWEKPTEPAYPPSGSQAPAGPPPGYDHNRTQYTGPEKGGYGSNNPYGSSGPHSGAGSAANINDDEALARKLQAEEEARARQSGSANRAGASDGYYNSASTPQPQYSNELPPREQDRGKSKGGFLGKLLGKASSSRPSQGYGQQYGGYPQQGGGFMHGAPGYAPQQGYYGGGGYPPQQQYYQQPHRKTGGGLGGAGGMALGAGAGLLGGAMLMNGIDDMQDHAYEEGYDQGVSLWLVSTFAMQLTDNLVSMTMATMVVVTISAAAMTWAVTFNLVSSSHVLASFLFGLTRFQQRTRKERLGFMGGWTAVYFLIMSHSP